MTPAEIIKASLNQLRRDAIDARANRYDLERGKRS